MRSLHPLCQNSLKISVVKKGFCGKKSPSGMQGGPIGMWGVPSSLATQNWTPTYFFISPDEESENNKKWKNY